MELVFDSRNFTGGEYAPLWLDSIREAVGPRTWKRYEELTRLHVVPQLGSTKLDKLNALQVQSLYRRKPDAGLSPITVRKVHGTLYRALKQERRRTYPNNPNRNDYLKSLERLRHVMILLELGYGGREMAMLRVNRKNRCPMPTRHSMKSCRICSCGV